VNNPFDRPGRWFRGNLHTHTTESDATWTVEDCCAFYRDAGYDFLAITDHWKLTDASGHQAPGFLLIPGVELNGWTDQGVQHHVVGLGLGSVPERTTAATLQTTIDAIREAGGLAIVAHPEWSRQEATHIAGTRGAFAIEVFNATSEIREGNGLSSRQWDDLLRGGERWLAVAADDAHMLSGFPDNGKAWVHVRAGSLTADAILSALEAGHFWSTTGPSLHGLTVNGRALVVECTPACRLRVVVDGADAAGVEAAAAEEHHVGLPPGWGWFRVECHGDTGVAWSNPIFAETPGTA
jgi:hypothetical protein